MTCCQEQIYICCSSDTYATLHILRRFQITELIIIILLIFHYCKFIFCFRVTYFLGDHLCKYFFCVLITVKIHFDIDDFLLRCKTSIFCKKRAANPFFRLTAQTVGCIFLFSYGYLLFSFDCLALADGRRQIGYL